MKHNLFQFIIWAFLGAIRVTYAQDYKDHKGHQDHQFDKRIETVNKIANMVDLVKTDATYSQSFNVIWLMVGIYAVIAGCFFLGCFGFIIKQYNDYKVYIKELNYMNNKV